MKVFLIGFMGSGKSTLGRQLADTLNIPFVDLDEAIEHDTGKSITELFETGGEDSFRAVEAEVLQKSVYRSEDMVMATGGGTPCFPENLSLMKKEGLTLYLKWLTDELYKRLHKDRKNRPLIRKLSGKKLRRFINDALKSRSPFYAQAEMVVHPELVPYDLLARQVRQHFKRGRN